MSRLGEQKQRIEDVRAAQYITGALRDISAVELKKLKKLFEKNDLFYAELTELFQLIWRIAHEKDVLATKKKKNKELFIAYTTNKHFYGSLNHDVMQEFIKGTDQKSTCLIIGNTGKQIWSSKTPKRREVSFFSFEQDDANTEEITNLLKEVESYEHVYVFYPGFTSVFQQDVQMVDITYRPTQTTATDTIPDDIPQYLLEPDLSEMVDFFTSQVRYALLEQLLLETKISRVAARLVKMDTADQNAEELIKVELHELHRIRTSFSSRRMLETVVGYIQWHNRKTQLIGR
jgi:F-type H+-transporting ATPase subunit gamma